MSNRPHHRAAAFTRRLQRVADRLPADPSNRERKPRAHYDCPRCQVPFRDIWQVRLHLDLMSCVR